MTSQEDRVNALIDDRLFKAYWDAVEHFETRDLVVVFSAEEEVDPVSAFARKRLLTEPGFPDSIRTKLLKPASNYAVQLKDSDAAFWLVVMFSAEESICVAVNGKMIVPGGNA